VEQSASAIGVGAGSQIGEALAFVLLFLLIKDLYVGRVAKEGKGREGVSEVQSFPPATAPPSRWFQHERRRGAEGALYVYYGYQREALMPGVLILYCKSL
jgi:hypothetical protein